MTCGTLRRPWKPGYQQGHERTAAVITRDRLRRLPGGGCILPVHQGVVQERVEDAQQRFLPAPQHLRTRPRRPDWRLAAILAPVPPRKREMPAHERHPVAAGSHEAGSPGELCIVTGGPRVGSALHHRRCDTACFQYRLSPSCHGATGVTGGETQWAEKIVGTFVSRGPSGLQEEG